MVLSPLSLLRRAPPQKKIIEILLRAGADIDQTSAFHKGATALELFERSDLKLKFDLAELRDEVFGD